MCSTAKQSQQQFIRTQQCKYKVLSGLSGTLILNLRTASACLFPKTLKFQQWNLQSENLVRQGLIRGKCSGGTSLFKLNTNLYFCRSWGLKHNPGNPQNITFYLTFFYIHSLTDITDAGCTFPDWQDIVIVSKTLRSGLNCSNGLPGAPSPLRSDNFSCSPLPLEIVSPVEDLLQQGDHSKGADEDEEQSSVSQQIPAWRRISVSHPS